MSNKPSDKDTKELDVQTRPALQNEVKQTEDSTAVVLLKQLLDEANQVNRATDVFSSKATNGYRRLHAAFRTLMTLRGEEFARGFVLFQKRPVPVAVTASSTR